MSFPPLQHTEYFTAVDSVLDTGLYFHNRSFLSYYSFVFNSSFFCVADRAGLPGGRLHLPGAVVPGVGRGGRDGGQGQGPDGPALTAGVSAALGPFTAEEAASEAAAARLTQSRQSLSLNYVFKVRINNRGYPS
jgi:hypothetical protein